MNIFEMLEGISNIDLKEELKDLNLEEDLSDVPSEQKIKDSIPSYTSEKLCSIVASNRYLNFNNELSILAMEELGKRRSLGSPFNYEDYIEDYLKDLPKLDFKIPDIRSLMDQLSGKFK